MTTKPVVRTPREWTEQCRECCGTGHVSRRERFSLWTPDEFEQREPIDPKHDLPRDAYVCTAAPGATIFEACKEGIGLSKMVGRPVAFEFNGAVAVCRSDSDPDNVAKAWWERAYGKTYEQSMAER